MSHLNPAAIFRGLVVNNQDPEGRARCQLQIPQLMGGARSGWAVPIPAVGTEVPPVGAQVMVAFEGADLTRPAYFAPTSSKIGADAVAAAAKAETDAQSALRSASAAQLSANKAESDAQAGIANAATAQTAANKAQSTANQAETDAQTGIKNAAAAQAAANQAQSSAAQAETDAQTAIKSAATATVSTDRLVSGSSTLNSKVAQIIAAALPSGSIQGTQLADDALDGQNAVSMTLTAASVNGQTLADTGWVTFADAGINFAPGFASYGTTCRFRALNGVVYLTGTVQVTSAMTTGSASSAFPFASWSNSSALASYVGGINGTIGSFTANASAGGAGVINLNGTNNTLLLGYRSVGQLPTGYFAFSGSSPFN